MLLLLLALSGAIHEFAETVGRIKLPATLAEAVCHFSMTHVRDIRGENL